MSGGAPDGSNNVYPFPPLQTVRHNLPATASRMIGRDAVVAQLLHQLHDTRLVSIVGAGGMGKTRVALAIAERACSEYIDGVWFVDLAPLRDPSLIAHAIASAAGLVVHSAQVLPALVRFLGRSRVLLVLDNCEHMIRAVACCVEQLLAHTPNVRIVTTSRCALRLSGEEEHQLQGLAAPAQSAGLSAGVAMQYPAVELFVDRACDRLADFVLDDADAPAVADICRNLDGIALAIELAAMRVDAFNIKDLSEQLQGRLRLLAGRRAGLERHRTLTATLDWSYRLLPEREARLLRAVAVFVGSFRLVGAAEVADLAPDRAADLLADLASRSLLSLDSAPGEEEAYRLMVTTRVYCAERRTEMGEDAMIRDRHARHVCRELERAAMIAAASPSGDWGHAYRGYIDELRTALTWSDADPERHPLLVRLTLAGHLLWNHFSLTNESRGHLARAVQRLHGLGVEPSSVDIQLQFALAGAILYTRGVTPEARSAVHRAIELSHLLGDADLLMRCLRLNSTLQIFCGEHDAAIRTLETFMSIARIEDPSILGEGDTHLGCAEIFVGRPCSALDRMQRLAAEEPKTAAHTQLARFQYSNSVNVQIVLCHAQWLTGTPDAALRSAGEVLRYGRLSAHQLSLSIGLAWNCLIYLWIGDDAACSEQTALLEELVEQHGIVMWRPLAVFCRGVLTLRRDPLDAGGSDDIRRALAEFRAIRHTARLPYYLAVWAELLAQRGDYREAEAAIAEAVQLAAEQNERWCLPEIYRIQAAVAALQGGPDDAERLLLRAIRTAGDIGIRSWSLKACCALVRLCQGGPREAPARRQLQQVYASFTEGFSTPDLLAAAALLDHGD